MTKKYQIIANLLNYALLAAFCLPSVYARAYVYVYFFLLF